MTTTFSQTIETFKLLVLVMIMSSTFNYLTVLTAQQNLTYGVETSNPFPFMVQSNTLLWT